MSLRNTIKSIKKKSPDPDKVKSSVFGLLVNTSTIHGVKYIGDLHSPKTTRTFWIIAFCLSILGCVYYATQVYDKWYVTPDIGLKVRFNSSRTVPFPAVTICPQTKIKRAFLDYNKALQSAFKGEMGDDSRKYFELALPLCTASHINLINAMNPNYTSIVALNGSDFVQTMSKVQFALNETLLGMKTEKGFHTENFEVEADRVMTSDGFCATHNLQDYPLLFRQDSDLSSDFDSYKNNRNSTWNPLDGYKDDKTDQYPKRIFSGSKGKVVFLLAQSPNDIDEGCLGPEQGFKIYWHMPNEIPSYMHRSVIVGVEKAKTLVMKATQVRSSDDLQRYDADQRRCFFEDEKPLQFFKSYTKTHCDMECLTNYTLTKCGCVKYFMPRNSSTPVCDITKLECAEEANDNWLENDESYRRNAMPCNCYPSCSMIKYDVLSSMDMDFKTEKTLMAFGDTTEFYEDFPNGTISRFTIEFEDFLIEAQENFLGYKMQHFISDCGGLLGLFMGCSILSLVELFYQLFVIIFAKPNPNQPGKIDEKKEEKMPTPKKDNRTVVFIEDDEVSENEKNK